MAHQKIPAKREDLLPLLKMLEEIIPDFRAVIKRAGTNVLMLKNLRGAKKGTASIRKLVKEAEIELHNEGM